MNYEINSLHTAIIHDWPAFWTVVCLGLVQISVTWYNNHLTIASLPPHVSASRRRRHHLTFSALLLVFVLLTFSLARLNDMHQYQADLIVARERDRQHALEDQLQQTLDAVNNSRQDLTAIRTAIGAHPQGDERTHMLTMLDRVTTTLDHQASSMQTQTRAQPAP